MAHLLADVADAGTIEDASLRYLRFQLRAEALRWHPKRIVDQPVDGIEHILEAREQGQGVVISFVHHGLFAGMFGALSDAGVPNTVVAASDLLGPDVGPNMRQHIRVVGRGGALLPASDGIAGIVERLRLGDVVCVACDVPGSSVLPFAGRYTRCSSGGLRAARIAGAPVVLVSHYAAVGGTRIRLYPPLRPQDFESVDEMMRHVMAHHERAVLALPEATYLPRLCWQVPEDRGAAATSDSARA